MRPRLLVAFVALVALALLAPSRAFAKAGGFAVLEGAGSERGKVFTAGTEGAVVAIGTGIVARLTPGTELLKLMGLQKIYIKGRGARTVLTLLVNRGVARFEFAESAEENTQALVVRTPDKLSAIVSTGTSTIGYVRGTAAVANHSGDAMYSLENGWRSVPVGNVCIHRPSQDGAAIEPLLTAPDFDPVTTIASGIAGSAKWSGASWRPVRGATGYSATLRNTASGESILTQRITEPRLEVSRALPPGSYVLTVRALDALGIEGAVSSPLPISVVGIELPAGAYVKKDGTVRLPSGSKARLTYADGLEMSYGRSTHFIPAEYGIGLSRGERTLVHIRRKGSPGIVSIAMAPRTLRAEIVIGPTKAMWPRDDARITVRLVDDEGGAIPGWIRPKVNVAVGLQTVNVVWSRNGDTLRGRVVPQATHGPWVLRVDVTDQFGLPLGYNFLEIEETTRQREPKPASATSFKPPTRQEARTVCRD